MRKLRGDYSDVDWLYSFWDAVDSSSTWDATCDCRLLGHPEHTDSCRAEGPSWETVRGAGCLATMSTRLRCNRPLLSGIPFCDFHFLRVESWLADRMDGHLRGLAEKTVKDNRRIWMRDSIARGLVADAEDQIKKSGARVYFLGIDDEVVKIGYSINPAGRVTQIRQGSSICPEGYDRKHAELIGTTPGGQHVEARLHSVLSPHRIAGEWFHLHDDVRAVMNFLIHGGDDAAANAVFLKSVNRPWWVGEGYETRAQAVAELEAIA